MVDDLRALLRRLTPAADPALALVVLVVSLQPLFREEKGPIPAWGYVLVVAQCLPLVVRRRWPLAVASVCGGLTMVYGLSSLPDPPVPYAGLVGLYSVAAHGSRDHANAAGVIAAFALAGSLIFDPAADLEDATVQILLFTTAWLLGDSARRRRDATAVLAERAAQLERTRAAESAAAVAAERNRIARELHDVVAHHLSMMVVQAEAGAVTATKDPARAVQVFDAIGAAGKHALREMRRLLGVLKESDVPAELAPQPGAADIAELVDGVRAAGLDVRLRTEGEQRALPSAADLSAYRIVQEALTNCVRHAGASHADVEVRYDADAVRIEIVDDGGGGSSEPQPGGHGLVAMRERVALVGGTLDAGPAPGGGWRVRATLPLAAEQVS
ncbi:MAG: sensor histidine kinase [Kribbellaceae bacterium]